MAHREQSHTSLAAAHWLDFLHLLQDHSKSGSVEIDGNSSTLAQVIGVSRHDVVVKCNQSAVSSLDSAHNSLQQSLSKGDVIYGVNTGFGGSADVRTKKIEALQRMLTRELSYGILPRGVREPAVETKDSILSSKSVELEDAIEQGYLPWTWVRAAIMLRANSLIKGFSGIRPVIVERLCDLLYKDVIPMIPLRGSISASGDLNPLAYIAGTLQGKSTIRVLSRDISQQTFYADQAMFKAGLEPVSFQAKEALSIVNGTAISTAAAVHLLHDIHQLAYLTQITTAMAVEALLGSPESFDPVFAECRPHPGQKESAQNILAFLDGSQLASIKDGKDNLLRQDRYSIRTASQWIGPSLEDIVLAHQQTMIECNSTTDNPLIDKNGRTLHGGNFQAKSITSASEKIRQSVLTFGRIMFTQAQELINYATSRGLPPNLVAEEPSESAIFKGMDLSMSALLSELGFLSAPVNYVQNAELGNQSLNSLALVSCRYTATSIRVLTEMMADHMLTVCQAVDLRAMQARFLELARPLLFEQTAHLFASVNPEGTKTQLQDDNPVWLSLWQQLLVGLDSTVTMDSSTRFHHIVKSFRSVMLDDVQLRDAPGFNSKMQTYIDAQAGVLEETWNDNRAFYLSHGDASSLLGKASKRMYKFIRTTLGVPFLHTEKIRTPAIPHPQTNGDTSINGTQSQLHEPYEADIKAPTVGVYTSMIYRAIRNGAFIAPMLEISEECRQ